MKKSMFCLLMIALILSYFDGIMTYTWISIGCVYEANPLISAIHKIAGLNNWLLMHTVFGIIIAIIIIMGKYEKVVKCWLIIEIIIMCVHLITLRLYLLL